VEPIGDRRLPREVTQGVEEAVRSAGLDPAHTLDRVALDRRAKSDEPTWKRGRSAVAAYFNEHASAETRATAIVGLGPQLTLGAMLAARDAGLVIPRDCAVVGLLGDSSALQSADPPVTIFDNPLKDVCARAARRLLERADGLDSAAEVLPIEPELTERGSVSDRSIAASSPGGAAS
ncbi:MAG: substrate-binding domain-containing protein, partial [Planctomycetota bacterium]